MRVYACVHVCVCVCVCVCACVCMFMCVGKVNRSECDMRDFSAAHEHLSKLNVYYYLYYFHLYSLDF